MLAISNEEKQAFLSDSFHKNLRLEFPEEDLKMINFHPYSAESFQYSSFTNRTRAMGLTPTKYGSSDYYYWKLFDYFKYANYIYLRSFVEFDDLSFASTPAKIKIGCGWRYVEGDPSHDVYYFNEYDDVNISGSGTNYSKLFEKIIPIPEGNPTRLFYFIFEGVDADGNTISMSCTQYRVSKTHTMLLKSNEMPEESVTDYNYYNALYYGINIEDIVSLDNARDPIENENIEAEGFSLTESICSGNNLKFGSCEGSVTTVNVAGITDKLAGKEFVASLSCDNFDPIDLGHFIIDSVKTTYKGRLARKKITAYDRMAKLDVSAQKWWDRYMKVANSNEYTSKGYLYTRQMLSTFDSISNWHGILWNYGEKTSCECVEDTSATLTRSIYDKEGAVIGTMTLVKTKINYSGSYEHKMFRISRDLAQALEETYRYENPNIADDGGGLGTIACYLVDEETASGKTYHYLVDSGNWFAVHNDCTSIYYYAPKVIQMDSGSHSSRANRYQEAQCATIPFDLPNATAKLIYYDWATGKIAKNDSITARNVIESLAEINGSFARYDRNGEFQFYRIRSEGLYPSNSLYPANTLYPVDNESEILTKSHYTEYISQDYSVSALGKIQIAGRDFAITYTGNDSPNVYIIDGNAFYCADGVNYDPDTSSGEAVEILPEVNEMLDVMFDQISRSSYVPYKATAQGCPWLEVGDRIAVFTSFGGEETFIFRRVLKGVQKLTDTLSASGDELNQEIEKYGKDWSEGNE